MIIDRVTIGSTSSHALQSSAATGSETAPGADIIEAPVGVGATVQSSRETASARENEDEYVVDILVGHHRTGTGMK